MKMRCRKRSAYTGTLGVISIREGKFCVPSQWKRGEFPAELSLLQPLYIMIEIDGIENIDHVQLGDPGGYDAAEEQLFVTTE